MNKKLLLLISFFCIIICAFIFINPRDPLEETGNSNMMNAQRYIEKKGYEVISCEQEFETYYLTREKLTKGSYMKIWGLQNVNPMDFIGKEIQTYAFITKNHILKKKYKRLKVMVLVSDDKAIGGFCLPDYEERTYGGLYSLDGKNVVEISGLSYPEWVDNWMKTYK